MIDETEGMPSSAVVPPPLRQPDPGLSADRLHARARLPLPRDQSAPASAACRRRCATSSGTIERLGGAVERDPDTDLLTINGEFTTSLVLARCRTTDAGSRRWLIRFDASLCPDITLAVRMAADNQAVLDYYLLPQLDLRPGSASVSPRTTASDLDCFRFDDLDYFFGMAERARLPVAA